MKNDDGGDLSGFKVLRFAHAFESGGGTERYLDDLDRALLERNAMTVVRLHLTRNPANTQPSERRVGRGTLRLVPLQVIPGGEASATDAEHSFRFRLKQRVRDAVLYNPVFWSVLGRKWARARALPRQPGQAIGAGAAAAAAMRDGKVDVAMLHYFGGADADEVIAEARRADVPVGLLNHYSNDRFLHLAIRQHAMLAQGLSGVNGLDVPAYARNGFTNLSDGIDTDFFRRENARRPADAPSRPILLLPARVVREKGALDLVRAAASLVASGMDCSVVLAGRADDGAFLEEVKREAQRLNLGDRLQFLGSRTLEELRDWYGTSAVMALPTYHHEGLPRVILESLSMKLPVVAYATGGVPDGISPGSTGFLVRTGDVADLGRRLGEILASDTLRASLGEAGREQAERRFSLAALAGRHERFYRQLAAAKGRVRAD